MLKAEVNETLLYGCATWALRAEHFAKLRLLTTYLVLLRGIGFQRRLRTNHATLSYAKVFMMARCESIETKSVNGGSPSRGAWDGKARSDYQVG